MHELSLCQGLIDLLEAERAARGFQAIDRVQLAIGSWANVDPQALRFGFAAASPGTIADGATLDIEVVPAQVWCVPCAAQRRVTERSDPCPVCGGSQLLAQSGEEMRLAALEVH
jgi:hydrogenase nickel incorporation protein HypA/HybF